MKTKEIAWHSRRRLRASVGASALLLATASHVQAQTAPSVTLGPSPLQQYGQALANDGITINSRYNGEFAANPSGGERQGAEFTGELSLGADFDLAKLVGLNGGSVQVLFTDRAGNSLVQKSINNSVSVQQIYGGGQTYQLTYFTYTQELFNNTVKIVVGRDSLQSHFDTATIYCQFQSNAVCGQPSETGNLVDDGSSYYPESTWGGTATFNVTPALYVKTGVYQDMPNFNEDANHGFDWGGAGSNGAQIAGEVGYAQTAPGALYPNQVDVGAVVDRGSYSAPWYSPNKQYGRADIYLQAERLVYQPVANSPQGLYLFAGAEIGLAGSSQSSNFSAEGGAVYQGVIPSRPLDDAAFMINETHYNNRFLDYEFNDFRVADGGTQHGHNDMIMMELNYTAQLVSWLNVTPNLQYVINPDGLGGVLPYPVSNLPNAFVIGVQFQLDVAKLLGLTAVAAAPPAQVMAPPAPIAAPAPTHSHTYLVFFDWDRSNLSPRATQIIAEAASDSRIGNVTAIDVSGYTDTSGAPHYNQVLSESRARSVEAQLVADGVPRSDIEIHAFGDTHLLVQTGQGVREPQNRRVEIVLR
jgi:porin